MTRELVELVERRRPDVVALAIPLSLAGRIDRPLARAMRDRVTRSADVSLETALWSSPLVQVRGTAECTLRATVAAVLWQRLPDRREALRAIWSIYAARHAAAPPLVRLEERLAYLAHLAALGLPADDGAPAADAIDRELRAVVAAMTADASRCRDLAAWSARALARLPAVVRDSEAARILGAAAAGWVAAPAEVAALAPSLEGARLARRLAPPSATSRRSIAVRRIGARIDVVPEPRDPPWATLEIAASPFALYVDDDREVPLRRDGATARRSSTPAITTSCSAMPTAAAGWCRWHERTGLCVPARAALDLRVAFELQTAVPSAPVSTRSAIPDLRAFWISNGRSSAAAIAVMAHSHTATDTTPLRSVISPR